MHLAIPVPNDAPTYKSLKKDDLRYRPTTAYDHRVSKLFRVGKFPTVPGIPLRDNVRPAIVCNDYTKRDLDF